MTHQWPKIALATCEAQRTLASEDRLLMQHLRGMGFPTEPIVWTNGDDRRDTLVIVRSCWDYHIQPARFLDWIEDAGHNGCKVLNSPAVIRWNHDKHYLRELQASGVRIAPTIWVEAGAESSLEQIMEEASWSDVVVKPAISATAWKTVRVDRQSVAHFEGIFQEIVQSGCALVQEFVEDVLSRGEWSLVFFDGVYSHAVLKRPAKSEFRVQREFGGTIDKQSRPLPSLIESAAFALQQCPDGPPLYARVDGIEVGSDLVVMEVELIEPALFLESDDAATARFAQAIAIRAD